MAVPTPSAPYTGLIGQLTGLMTQGSTQALGEPAKVADVITRLTDLDEPPVRLLLGSDALTVARSAATALADRDTSWTSLTRFTDRDDATHEQRDPLGLAAREPVATVRRFLDDVVNGGRLDAIDELCAPELTWHGGSLGTFHSRAEWKASVMAEATAAFTGMHLTVEDIVAGGEKVVVRFTNSGTQTGPFLGAPATGRYAEWLGIGIYTVTDGRITEAWLGEDILGMLRQLDAITLPA